MLDRLRWRQFLKLKPVKLRWVDWSRVFLGLSLLAGFMVSEPLEDLSDYMLRSRLRSTLEEIQPYFLNSGLEPKMPVPRSHGSPKEFSAFIMSLLRVLNLRPEPSLVVGTTSISK